MKHSIAQWFKSRFGPEPAYAYLYAAAEPLVNQFGVASLQITLTEPGWRPGSKLSPGIQLPKDPTVTVKAGSESCYVIVQIEQTNAGAWDALGIQYGYLEYGQFISGVVRPGWIPLPAANNAWYRRVDSSAADQVFPIFTTVQVPEQTTTEDLEGAASNTLTIRAWAVQAQGMENPQEAVRVLRSQM